jgi:hypothetical protein
VGEILELEESSDNASTPPEDEIFRAEVVGVRKVKSRFKDEQTGEDQFKMEFRFAIADPDGEFDGVNIWGETPYIFNTSPRCKLRNWSQEIMGAEFPPGYKLDTDVLRGQEVRIIIGHRKYTRKGETEESVHAFVKDVLRLSVSYEQDEPF